MPKLQISGSLCGIDKSKYDPRENADDGENHVYHFGPRNEFNPPPSSKSHKRLCINVLLTPYLGSVLVAVS